MTKILYVEDDQLLAKELQQFFEKYNYTAVVAADFSNIMSEVEHHNPDLILLDINLPNHDGFYWCRKIRQERQTPIIMLSSRDTRLDQMMGITIGADDYITKPIDLELLLIKIQALLRRSYDYVATTDNSSIRSVGKLILDIQKFTLAYEEKVEELTKNEAKILQKLFENQEEFVRRDLLMDYLWESESFIDENTLNVNMSRLRKKIVELSGKEYIETKRMVGYKIADVSGE
jgi:Response regulators consisting of a CheY-like receiver domain and a winged-helix DNA-binding domain